MPVCGVSFPSITTVVENINSTFSVMCGGSCLQSTRYVVDGDEFGAVTAALAIVLSS